MNIARSHFRRAVLFTAALSLSFAAARPALAEGWSWLPFSKKEEKKEPAHQRPLKSNLGVNNAMQEGKHLKRPVGGQPEEPTVWKRMGDGAKSMYTKTTDAITPAKKPKAPQPSEYRKPVSRKTEKKGTFGNWFRSEPEPENQPGTVSEWMKSGKRIQP